MANRQIDSLDRKAVRIEALRETNLKLIEIEKLIIFSSYDKVHSQCCKMNLKLTECFCSIKKKSADKKTYYFQTRSIYDSLLLYKL